jgi:hypothetical protein
MAINTDADKTMIGTDQATPCMTGHVCHLLGTPPENRTIAIDSK